MLFLPLSLLITWLFGLCSTANIIPLSPSSYTKNIGHPRHRFSNRVVENSKILTKPTADRYPVSADNKVLEEFVDDFEDQEIGSVLVDGLSKRDDDDYGHLRFGKRDDDAFDYGRISYVNNRIVRNGKQNADTGNNDDYGHLRFGR
ncbi:hypothetical protein CHUAL_002490 [Chamberlinius hualienensis]